MQLMEPISPHDSDSDASGIALGPMAEPKAPPVLLGYLRDPAEAHGAAPAPATEWSRPLASPDRDGAFPEGAAPDEGEMAQPVTPRPRSPEGAQPSPDDAPAELAVASPPESALDYLARQDEADTAAALAAVTRGARIELARAPPRAVQATLPPAAAASRSRSNRGSSAPPAAGATRTDWYVASLAPARGRPPTGAQGPARFSRGRIPTRSPTPDEPPPPARPARGSAGRQNVVVPERLPVRRDEADRLVLTDARGRPLAPLERAGPGRPSASPRGEHGAGAPPARPAARLVSAAAAGRSSNGSPAPSASPGGQPRAHARPAAPGLQPKGVPGRSSRPADRPASPAAAPPRPARQGAGPVPAAPSVGPRLQGHPPAADGRATVHDRSAHGTPRRSRAAGPPPPPTPAGWPAGRFLREMSPATPSARRRGPQSFDTMD